MKGKLEPSVRQALVEEGKNLKEGLIALEEDLVQLTDKLQQEAQCIPNTTHPDVPVGGEENSVLRKMVGSQREFSFAVKDHLQLGKELDLFDFDAAAEVSGSKFYYLKNEAVLLELGLINWALAEVSKRGFTPLITPEIVRSSVVEKCGFQPRGQNTQVAGELDNVEYSWKKEQTLPVSHSIARATPIMLILFASFLLILEAQILKPTRLAKLWPIKGPSKRKRWADLVAHVSGVSR